MSRPIIYTDECSGCGTRVDACPESVLELVGDVADVVNEDSCIACGTCLEECQMGAITEIEED
ncbi:MAG: 4Fe-4S binding protein [Actinomycetota bacterium]|jgi:NAD-dependent dihydropyrimidine dehydrogenase PreA subunit|nr:4Fe-4S binding protein [Actinomycetota bacterium]